MSSEQENLINLSVHESSDPEMLKRDAESKTGSSPNTESSDSHFNSSDPELLRHESDSGIASKPEVFGHEYEEDRENPPQADVDLPHDDKLAESQIMNANLYAG